jgi:hypothetical protein
MVSKRLKSASKALVIASKIFSFPSRFEGVRFISRNCGVEVLWLGTANRHTIANVRASTLMHIAGLDGLY